MKKLGVLVLLVGFVMGLSACNTIAGFGEDVQTAGEKLEKAAKK